MKKFRLVADAEFDAVDGEDAGRRLSAYFTWTAVKFSDDDWDGDEHELGFVGTIAYAPVAQLSS
jgi:hypothetical protein